MSYITARGEIVHQDRPGFNKPPARLTVGDAVKPLSTVLTRPGAPGTVVWAMGTVKQGQPPYLESEFEGPGQHRRRYFEDYLVTLTRPAYDLYPGAMLLEWEFPRIEAARGANDLISRVM